MNLDDLVSGLPDRRAVLFCLPEFGRLQFDQFRKIIAGCLPEREWWTWLGQDWVIPIIGTLRSGEAWRELWKNFNCIKVHTYGTKEFALWLFPQVIPEDSVEFEEFREFVSSSLGDAGLARRAIEVALNYELPVDLELVSEETLFEVLHTFPYRRRLRNPAVATGLIERLPRPLALRFLCTIQPHFHGIGEVENIWTFAGLPVQELNPSTMETEIPSEPTIVVVSPSWLRFTIEGQLPLAEIDNSGGAYATYLSAVFEALQESENPTLYEVATSAMNGLPEIPTWQYRCENILGPSPEQFSSVFEWRRYRSETRILFSTTAEASVLYDLTATFGADAAESKNDWMVFLFPPRQWDCLVSDGLLEADVVATLRKSKWAILADLLKDWIPPVDVIQYSHHLLNTRIEIPVSKLLRLAVDLHNSGDLSESPIVNEVLVTANGENINADELHAIINSIKNPSEFPNTWARAVIELALTTEGVNVGLLSGFWVALNVDRKEAIWLRLMPRKNTAIYLATISALLGLNDDAGLDLAARILSRFPDVSPEMSMDINRRAASSLLVDSLSDVRRGTLVRCLLQSKSTIEEAKLYGEYDAVKAVLNSTAHAYSQIVERLNAMTQTMRKEEFPMLRTELKRLLSRKEDFPPEISAAALDALVQVNVASCQPITEVDWQMNS